LEKYGVFPNLYVEQADLFAFEARLALNFKGLEYAATLLTTCYDVL